VNEPPGVLIPVATGREGGPSHVAIVIPRGNLLDLGESLCLAGSAHCISDFWPPGQRLIRSIFFGPQLAAEEAKEVREKIHVSLAQLEGYAEGDVWIAGPDLTAADIVAYPSLKLLLRASRRPEAIPLALGLDGFETRFPGIAAWMRRVEQLPGYDKTYPPHWRQA
jgi:glutathione S-transferase